MAEPLAQRLWVVMTELYADTFVNRYGETPTEGWTKTLAEVHPNLIGVGIEKLRNDPRYTTWPPNPMEFKALCVPAPEDYGFPSVEEAYQQAANSIWKFPIVYFAALGAGTKKVRELHPDKIFPKFKREYNNLLNVVYHNGPEVLQWPEGMDPKKRIEHEPGETKEQERERKDRGLDHLKVFREKKGV